MTSEPALLYAGEVSSLVRSLERMRKLNTGPSDKTARNRINSELDRWMERLRTVLRTRQ